MRTAPLLATLATLAALASVCHAEAGYMYNTRVQPSEDPAVINVHLVPHTHVRALSHDG